MPSNFLTELGVVKGTKFLTGQDGVTGDEVVAQRFHVKCRETPEGAVTVVGVYSLRVGMEKGMYFPNDTQAEVHFDNITRPVSSQELAYTGQGLMSLVNFIRSKQVN